MPWTVKDVDRFKKGLTPAQKKKWVRIANSALKDCQAEGGKDCEGRAIRIANSKFEQEVIQMGLEKQTVPQSALHLMEKDCFAKVGGEDDKPKLEMTIYSGGVIRDHFWWGNLAIDLQGGKFTKKSYPILESHDVNKRIGFSKGKPIIDGSLRVDSENTEFVDTKEADAFIKLSKQGFPFESSMYARPLAVERLEKGTSAEVNGMTLKGPATIWRQWEFKEASVCVFGWDSNTKSQAFANTEVELDVETSTVQLIEDQTKEKEVMEAMTLEELKEKNPDAFSKLMEEAKGAVTEDLKTELETKFADEKKQMEQKFSQEKGELQDRVLELEKRDAIRSENEIRAMADAIWTRKLSESEIPEHLFEKVSRMVSYNKFVTEGKFDRDTFVKAVDKEIKDWEDKGVTSSVLGMSFTSKSEDGSSEEDLKLQEKSVEQDVDKLASFVQVPATSQ